MKNAVQKKSYLYTQFKALKVTDDGNFGYFEGYAITFGNVDRDNDVAVAGCFAQSLKEFPNVKMCWQHDICKPIGSYLEIREDEKGLFVKGRINLGVEKGREAYALLKAGDLDSLSIGYMPTETGFEYKDGIRYLTEVMLYEISLVTIPANPEATIDEVKGKKITVLDVDNIKTIRDFESVLRESGMFSKEASVKLASMLSLEAKDSTAAQRDSARAKKLELLRKTKDLLNQTKNLRKG